MANEVKLAVKEWVNATKEVFDSVGKTVVDQTTKLKDNVKSQVVKAKEKEDFIKHIQEARKCSAEDAAKLYDQMMVAEVDKETPGDLMNKSV